MRIGYTFAMGLLNPTPPERKLMRQAKPDDVFTFVTFKQVLEDWPLLAAQLGHKREFWQWLVEQWQKPNAA